MRASLLAVVCALAVAACGPGKPSSPPDGGGSGGGGSGGTTGDGSGGGTTGGGTTGGTTGGGTTSGGGTGGGGSDQGSGGQAGGSSGGTTSGGPSGSGGDQGGTSGGGTTGGTTSGGGSGTGGGTASGPVASSDGTVVVERVDADPECDGLLPASAPDAVSVRLPATSCTGAGLSEGGGHVAVRDGNDTTGEFAGMWVERQAFTADGHPQNTFQLRSTGLGAGADDAPAIAQADGWLGLKAWGRVTFTPVELHWIAPDGSDRRTQDVAQTNGLIHEIGIAEDPLGGVLVWQHWHADPSAPGGCSGSARRYDATGAPAGAAAPFGGCFAVGAAVSRAGESLALERTSGDPIVHWLARDGSAARAPSSDPALGGLASVRMAPLLDGSIAVDVGSGWTRRFPHLADRSEPAPGWLAAAPPRFRNTRGNRGYAFFAGAPNGAPPASADCSQRVELRAPSGRLCGTVTLKNPGGACTPGLADQGWDGTVIERNAREGCAWRWWPRLLAE